MRQFEVLTLSITGVKNTFFRNMDTVMENQLEAGSIDGLLESGSIVELPQEVEASSSEMKVSDAAELIGQMGSTDEVNAFVGDDTRKGVLTAQEARLSELEG